MHLLQNIRELFETVHFIDGAQLPRPDCWSTQPHQADTESWEHIGSKTCGTPCHLPSSADNRVTMELATVNDENPCGDRGLDAVCPPVAIDGTDGEKWRRRESNPQVQSRNSEVAQRLWNMLQDVGVSWEWKDDANHQPLPLGHEELAEILWVYDGERLPQPISVADRLACPAVSPVRLIGVPFLAQSAAAASGTRG